MERLIHNRPPEASMLLLCLTRTWLQSSVSHHWASTRDPPCSSSGCELTERALIRKRYLPRAPHSESLHGHRQRLDEVLSKRIWWDAGSGWVGWPEKNTERWSVTSWIPYTLVKNVNLEVTYLNQAHPGVLCFLPVGTLTSFHHPQIKEHFWNPFFFFFPWYFFLSGSVEENLTPHSFNQKKCWLITPFLTWCNSNFWLKAHAGQHLCPQPPPALWNQI